MSRGSRSAALLLGVPYSFVNVIDEELDSAAYHMARAQEHFDAHHWRFALSELHQAADVLDAFFSHRTEGTAEQRRDAAAMGRRANWMFLKLSEKINAEAMNERRRVEEFVRHWSRA